MAVEPFRGWEFSTCLTLPSLALTTFCRLDELGLEVTVQQLEPDRAVLACRVVQLDQWCRRCGCAGTPRDSGVPHTLSCALVGVSLSWFYKWLERAPTPTEQRRAQVDATVAEAFKKARGLHGSPRLLDDLRDAGWVVWEKTVADSMRRRGLIARRIKRRSGLTRQDKSAPKFLTCSNGTSPRPHRTAAGSGT